MGGRESRERLWSVVQALTAAQRQHPSSADVDLALNTAFISKDRWDLEVAAKVLAASGDSKAIDALRFAFKREPNAEVAKALALVTPLGAAKHIGNVLKSAPDRASEVLAELVGVADASFVSLALHHTQHPSQRRDGAYYLLTDLLRRVPNDFTPQQLAAIVALPDIVAGSVVGHDVGPRGLDVEVVYAHGQPYGEELRSLARGERAKRSL